MNFLKLKSILFYLTITLLCLTFSNLTKAQLTTNNGSLFFKNNKQRFTGNGLTDFRYYSNNAKTSYLSFYNNQNIMVGRVYGGIASDNNPIFGLTDADGNWAISISNDKFTNFNINNDVKMTLRSNGQLELLGTRDATGTPGSGVFQIGKSLRFDDNEIITNTGKALLINADNNGDVVIGSTFRMDASEDCVRIGNVLPKSNYKLFVEKGILTEKVKVAVKNSSEWADYVFEENYDLMPIDELENYVAKNKHLPNVPSADAMVEDGLDVAKMDAKLLEKIEEAYLYIIELKKEVDELKTAIKTTK